MSGKEAREQSELDNSHIKVINFVMMMVMMMMMMMMMMIIIIIILIIVINGSRNEWSPIRSVILYESLTKSNDRVAGVRFV